MARSCIAWTLAALLIGCHAGNCSRQDLLESAVQMDADVVSHSHGPAMHGSGHAHPLLAIANIMHDDGMDCSGKCNGEELTPDDTPHFYECWGDFKWECKVEQDNVKAKTEFGCHGAFTYFPGHIHDAMVDPDLKRQLAGLSTADADDVSIDMTYCEGNSFAFFKSSVSMPSASRGEEAHMFIQGVGCSGRTKSISAVGDTGTRESYFGCEDLMISGAAQKSAQASKLPRGGAGEDLEAAAEYLRRSLDEHGSWTGWFDSDSPHHTVQDEDQGLGVKDGLVQGRDEELEDGEMDATQQIAAVASVVDTWGRGGDCEVTCNGHDLPLHGWWPCKGVTKVECNRETAPVPYNINFQCHGCSLPAFKTCMGLTTLHVSTDSDQASTEIMETTKGKMHAFDVHKHGWKGNMAIATGLTSVHTKVNVK